MTNTMNWRDRYTELGNALVSDAPSAGPFLFGFSICVDAIWSVNERQLRRMTEIASPGHDSEPAARVLRAVIDRIVLGRGGELFEDWGEGPDWFDEFLGEPNRLQVGGTGPQAAWTLAELGTRCVIPLADRSPAQLAVLHPRIEVATGDGLVSVQELIRASAEDSKPGRPRHYILEFAAGTSLGLKVLPRSTRIILRFAQDGIECDNALVALHPEVLRRVRGAVVSGMNAIQPEDTRSWEFLNQAVDEWVEFGVDNVHLELADYPSSGDLRAAAAFCAGRAKSLGLSLSELRTAGGSETSSPVQAAQGLGDLHSYAAVVVHADDWSLAVHRDDPVAIERRLMSGNLLASARATRGIPQGELALPSDASFATDIPQSGALGDGWWATCVPSPWLRTPQSTIGLGDSFVAGFQLGAYCRDRAKAASI